MWHHFDTSRRHRCSLVSYSVRHLHVCSRNHTGRRHLMCKNRSTMLPTLFSIKIRFNIPTKHKDGLRWYKTVLNHLIYPRSRRVRLERSWGCTGRKKTIAKLCLNCIATDGLLYEHIRWSFNVFYVLFQDGLITI